MIIVGNLQEVLKEAKTIDDLVFIKEEEFFDFQNLIRVSTGKKPVEKPAEAPAPKEERESIAQLRKLAANYEITPEQIMAYLAANPRVKERFGSLDGIAFADLPDAIVSWLSKGMEKVAAKIKG